MERQTCRIPEFECSTMGSILRCPRVGGLTHRRLVIHDAAFRNCEGSGTAAEMGVGLRGMCESDRVSSSWSITEPASIVFEHV